MNKIYNSVSDFDFELPLELIAQYPKSERTASRLLRVNIPETHLSHHLFPELLAWVRAGDLIVLNDTKVIPARLMGRKKSGGQIECLIERILTEHEALVHLRANKPVKVGTELCFADAVNAKVLNRRGDLFHLYFESELTILRLLERYGSIPLPHYIERKPENADIERYQTVYAQHPGAVAAPTAGLHFDANMLAALRNQGVEIASVTLHIGAGTFQPVRVSDLDHHIMHSEYMVLSIETCQAINRCRQRGGQVIAVGTTVTRCLETASQSGITEPFCGETNLFIRPGYQFRCVDALLTNFHLPKSTLLMLVSAFGGYDLVMQAYQEAIKEKYRFFSFGDAMFLTCR